MTQRSLNMQFGKLPKRLSAALLAIVSLPLLLVPASAGEPFCQRSDAFVAGEDGYHTYRLPTLVGTKHGTLLLFCDGRKKHSGDIGKIDPVLRRSLDGGKTWQPMQVLRTDPSEKAKVGNPCPIYDRRADTVHLIFLHNLTKAFLLTSSDDGASFAAPRDITVAFRKFDYPWSYVATGHVHGIQLRSGRLVAPVWVNNVPRNHERKGQMRNGVLYSDDHGRTWHPGGLVDYFHSLNESSVFEASDGSLSMNCRAMHVGSRVVSRSRDQGQSWSKPTLEAELPDPTCQASTLVLPSRDGRHRVLFCNPATKKSRTHLTVRLSYDDGRTWPISKLVEEGGAGYCDMAVAPDGTIFVAYERAEKRYSDRLTVVRFNLEWLTDGKDSLAAAN